MVESNAGIEVGKMEEALNRIQLSSLIPKFIEENIDLDVICQASDSELIRLGVSTLGERIRLREVCKKLLSNSAVPGPGPASSSSSVIPLSSSSNSSRLENLQERRSLFTSYNHNSRSRGGRRNARKRPVSRSWTVSFFCLANKFAFKVPNNSEKVTLKNAGLGFKKIKLDLSDGEEDVVKKLTSSEIAASPDCGNELADESTETLGFPALKNCGGFEILTCQANSRDLVVMNCSLAAKDIKNHMGGSQSKIYIRPIQQCLSTKSQLRNQQSLLKENCRKCGSEFLLKELRRHVTFCGRESLQNINPDLEVSSSSSSSSSEDEVHRETGHLPDNSTINETGHLPDNSTINETNHPPDNSTINETDHHLPGNSTSNDNMAFNIITVVEAEETNFGIVEVQPAIQTKDTMKLKVSKVIKYIKEHHLEQNPVTILKELQKCLVEGRVLEITDLTADNSGITNFIMVDRGEELLKTAFDELKCMTDFSRTLEVQFYGEVAQDYGGPRKEFFLMMLRAIKDKYFDGSLKIAFAEDYYLVGILFGINVPQQGFSLGLTTLQNGKMPTFLEEDQLQSIFGFSTEDIAINNLRKGLDEFGLVQVCRELPLFLHLFRPSPGRRLTSRILITLLTPDFEEEGTNKRKFQNQVYAAFVKYIREVESGRRENVTLEKMLVFVTGTDEEPILGFEKHPSILFIEANVSFIPTSSTCINQLKIPIPTNDKPLCERETLFGLYDYAFLNSYYGLA